METLFRWRCSYMGTTWFDVTDSTGSYEAEFRREAGDYELSIANGETCRRDTIAAIGILRRAHSLPGQWESGKGFELPQETVDAFNAWRLEERRNHVATMKAQPDRYGEIDESDSFLFPAILPARRGWYVSGAGWQS